MLEGGPSTIIPRHGLGAVELRALDVRLGLGFRVYMLYMSHGLGALELRALDVGFIWRFPKIRGTFLGVPIIRTVVYWGLYWGTLILGNYHMFYMSHRLNS